MKILCYLFALIVLLLSANPCCADNDCSGTTATEGKAGKSASSSDQDCMGCSPFFSCGTCAGFTVATTVAGVPGVLPQECITHGNTYRQPYIQHVAIAIWQPPQLR